MKDINILIVGVGGQGTLLASVILGNMALEEGYDVKLSEVHGMAQRGGSVVTHVKIGEGPIGSPLIEEGGADIIVAFELLEGYRWAHYLKKGGTMYVNDNRINPMPVIIGSAEYPEDIKEFFKNELGTVKVFDALAIAEKCGSPKAVNTVLLGAMSGDLPFDEKAWIKAIEGSVKSKFIGLNKEAFTEGRKARNGNQ